MAVTTYQIGREVCQALGLDSARVTSINLDMKAGDIVTLSVGILPDRKELIGVVDVISRYELVERPGALDWRDRIDSSADDVKRVIEGMARKARIRCGIDLPKG